MTGQQVVLATEQLSFQNFLSYPDLEVCEGEFIAVAGASGAGKSTLFKLMNYTQTPTQGTIYYRGMPTHEMDTVELRRKILLVSQSTFLFDGTISANFDRFCEFRQKSHLTEAEKKQFLQLAQVPFGLDEICQTMSGGERQRVYIAICLSFQPDILLLDEPTSALDQTTGSRLFHAIRDYAQHQGMTVLVISHDRSLLDGVADRTILIERRN